ncbi:MAG: PHP domain-containing protein [Hominenteromicrobium sp.]
MKRYRYDLHTHSCLSPCGDNDMTPNNLVNMAALLGCEILALTDHNTCRNTPAAVRVGEQAGILVVPGMELCTAEEAHVVCLFETVEGALGFDEYVQAHTMLIPNRPEIFGEQRILNEDDEQIGEIEHLLITATEIGVNEVQALVQSYGGTAFPAHVNKDAYSVIASLGAIPPEAGFRAAELSAEADRGEQLRLHPELQELLLLRDSDAHYLHLMREELAEVELPERTAKALIDLLRGCGEGAFYDFGM